MKHVDGKGTVRRQAKIKIKIPAGIDNDQTIVLRNEGEPGERGRSKRRLIHHNKNT